jgi:hypothetical protein
MEFQGAVINILLKKRYGWNLKNNIHILWVLFTKLITRIPVGAGVMGLDGSLLLY